MDDFDSADTVIIAVRPRTKHEPKRTPIFPAAIFAAILVVGAGAIGYAIPRAQARVPALQPVADPKPVVEVKPVVVAEPIAPTVETERAMPPELTQLLAKHRYATAHARAKQSDHPPWARTVAAEWKSYVLARAKKAKLDLYARHDALAEYAALYPRDRDVENALSALAVEESRRVVLLTAALKKRGLDAELERRADKRQYTIRARWTISRDAEIAAVADPTIGGFGIMYEIMANVGEALGDSDVRVGEARIAVGKSKAAISFPGTCARQLAAARERPLAERAQIMSCAKPIASDGV